MTGPYVVQWAAPGRLAMMPRPDGGSHLPGALAALRDQGVDLLVSALTDRDRRHLGLIAEPEVASAHGLAYREFPIPDFGVPDRDALIMLSHDLAGEVRDGRYTVVHCHGGVGRTGVIVGATLVALGATPDQAMDLMRTARGRRSPETGEQVALLHGLTPGS
jgi:protein-tyrosine phosphatase